MALPGPVIQGETAAGAQTPIRVDATGQLITTMPTSGAFPKAEDAVAASGDIGAFTLGVRAPVTPVAATSAAGDYSAFLVDAEGKTIISGAYAAPEQTKQARIDYTAITDLQLLPSAGAGLRNYITDLTVENTGASAARFLLRDGTTTVWSCTVPAGSTFTKVWETPLRLTAATVVNGQLGVAGTVTVSVSGYVGV